MRMPTDLEISRRALLRPEAAVIVTTVRAMKAHTGKYHLRAGKPMPRDLFTENPDDVRAGAANLRKLASAGARGTRLGRRGLHLSDVRRHAHHAWAVRVTGG